MSRPDIYKYAHIPRIIVHAGGVTQGKRYTNTLDALEDSVRREAKWVEIDFSWTSDNHLVLLHDWNECFKWLAPSWKYDRVPTLAEFKKLTYVRGWTQMDFFDLTQWLLINKDIKIITDVKDRETEAIEYILNSSKGVTRNFIFQIYAIEDCLLIKEEKDLPIILSLYKYDCDFFVEEKFSAIKYLLREYPGVMITLPFDWVKRSVEWANFIKNSGYLWFTHPVNSIDNLSDFLKIGGYGVYSSFLDPKTSVDLKK